MFPQLPGLAAVVDQKAQVGLLKTGLKLCKVSYGGAGKREQQRVSERI